MVGPAFSAEWQSCKSLGLTQPMVGRFGANEPSVVRRVHRVAVNRGLFAMRLRFGRRFDRFRIRGRGPRDRLAASCAEGTSAVANQIRPGAELLLALLGRLLRSLLRRLLSGLLSHRNLLS